MTQQEQAELLMNAGQNPAQQAFWSNLQQPAYHPPSLQAQGMGMAGPLNSMLMGGMGTMQNLGSTVGQGFGLASILGSQNAQASYGPEAAIQVERERTNRLQSILPTLAGLLGGHGGGMTGFTGPAGQSATLGQGGGAPMAQQAPAPVPTGPRFMGGQQGWQSAPVTPPGPGANTGFKGLRR